MLSHEIRARAWYDVAMDESWDRLRSFEAVARAGSLTKAARALGVSQSTISRHLAALEAEAGSPLLLREAPIRLTERGDALLAAVGPMVDAALAARAALEDAPEIRGEVTIATVGEVVRWTLVQALPALFRAAPHLRVRVLASNQLTSLAAGDADLALRFARPERGDLVGRRLAPSSYGLFAARGLELGPDTPWLGLAGSLAEIPEQRWAERAFAGRPARLSVEDVESLGLAVRAGLGVAVLPRGLARRLELDREITPDLAGGSAPGPIPTRDLWLVIHRAKQRLPRVRVVADWVTATLAERADGDAVVVHEGRGGHVAVGPRRYDLEHVEGGRFAIHVPARAPRDDVDALRALVRRERGRFTLEGRGRSGGRR